MIIEITIQYQSNEDSPASDKALVAVIEQLFQKNTIPEGRLEALLTNIVKRHGDQRELTLSSKLDEILNRPMVLSKTR